MSDNLKYFLFVFLWILSNVLIYIINSYVNDEFSLYLLNVACWFLILYIDKSKTLKTEKTQCLKTIKLLHDINTTRTHISYDIKNAKDDDYIDRLNKIDDTLAKLYNENSEFICSDFYTTLTEKNIETYNKLIDEYNIIVTDSSYNDWKYTQKAIEYALRAEDCYNHYDCSHYLRMLLHDFKHKTTQIGDIYEKLEYVEYYSVIMSREPKNVKHRKTYKLSAKIERRYETGDNTHILNYHINELCLTNGDKVAFDYDDAYEDPELTKLIPDKETPCTDSKGDTYYITLTTEKANTK